MKNKKIPTEIYDRVAGYYRPVNQFNAGKQAEQKDRKRYNISELKKCEIKSC